MKNLLLLPTLCFLLPALTPVTAQQADTTKAKAKPPQITLQFLVRDKKGTPISNVSAADFTLTEDNQPQKIQALAKSSKPLRLGLLEDTSRELASAIDEERKSAGKVIDDLLTAPLAEAKDPKKAEALDQIYLIHFDSQVELLEDFTAQPARLHRELDNMEASRSNNRSGRPDAKDDDRTGDDNGQMSHQFHLYGQWGGGGNSGGGQGRGPGGGDRGEGGREGNRASRQLFDAVYLSANELMKSQRGRKALIVISDGVDSGSKVAMSEAIDAAEQAGVLVYTIYLKADEGKTSKLGNLGRIPVGGGGWPGGGGPGGRPSSGGGAGDSATDGKKVLERLATRTGGRYFEAKKKDKLVEIYTEIEGDLRNLCELSYTPELLDKEGGFHKLALKPVKHDDWTVTLAEGYFAPPVR